MTVEEKKKREMAFHVNRQCIFKQMEFILWNQSFKPNLSSEK